MEWVGPYKIGEMLKNCMDYKKQPWPPDEKGVYLISMKKWDGKPTKNCVPLYVGSTTGKIARFRVRVGDLIADIFGFFSEEGEGHHSGGLTLHKYCKRNKVHPFELYLGWAKNCKCVRCAETKIYSSLKPKNNKINPSRCSKHTYFGK